MNKKRRSYMLRPINKIEVIQRFLIVCEGGKTEPNYFRRYRVPKMVVDVQGLGYNTVRLIQEAIEIRNWANHEGEAYDQVWCVLDRDTFPAANFNTALQLAAQNSISVAYSNEAFELWYLLHFCYLDAGITREDYIERLGHYLGHPYQKNSESMYEELIERQLVAINNAVQLLAQYTPPQPVIDNPSTTVHLLVQQLNHFIR